MSLAPPESREAPAALASAADAPTVSVVIPIYNRPQHVPDLIETLNQQTFTDWEAVLVDDGSTSDIAGAVAPYLSDPRIRFHRLDRNGGVSAARNYGVSLARGRYVAFLDSDDCWGAEKLSKQVDAMEAAGPDEPAFCVTLTTVLMQGGWRRVRPNFDPRPGQPFGDYLYRDGGFAQASSLMTSRKLALATPFREELRQYEDHLFYIDLAASGAKYLVVREPLTTWRNDERPDRLGSSDDLSRGMAFLTSAGDLLSPRVRTAFRLRVLGEPLFRHKPLTAAALVFRAVFEGALRPKQLAAVTARRLLPTAVWDRIRRRAN